MKWRIDSNSPIYRQLMEYIVIHIVSGRYVPGERLPSVRDLAEIAAVNPNTMQKALTELEKEGLVYSQRTTGRFVTQDKELIQKKKKNIALHEIDTFLTKMESMGFSRNEIRQLIREAQEETSSE
ncbi:MAG: GntR family transcriptional regulator [Eubacteriaceae bacterium]|jgi:DNA-binding transcriptional regulator YhcF (GntR family)|nr:GntR family transcriptional regulator [Eubacteriaceae bacterium]